MTGDDRPPHDGETATAWVCPDCDDRWYYSRALCPSCGCAERESAELGTGTLVATTTARVTPPDVREENPLGLAAFSHDVNVLAQLPHEESIQPTVGDEVRLIGNEPLRGGVEGPRLHVTGSDGSEGTPSDAGQVSRSGKAPEVSE